MSAFLRYVVVQAATGNKGRIKAYTVAVDALGKPETFDPQNDPVVRVLAGRLRSTLSAYYEQHADADVKIDMKPGSYVPTFILREVHDQPSHESEAAKPQIGDAAAPGDVSVDSVVLSVDLAQAANNQWTADNADESVADTGTLDVRYQQTSSDRTPTNTPSTLKNSASSWLSPLISLFRKFPTLTSAAALLGALTIGIYWDELVGTSEPALLASHSAQDAGVTAGPQRPPQRARPDSISLFFSATALESALVSQVYMTMSSVFSATDNLRVYRTQRPAQVQDYWPEDYQVALHVLPLLDETQLSVQLVDAQTGRVAHSEILHLSAGAPQGLSSEDLQTIIKRSQRLISDDGPLTRDYKNKTDSP